MCVQSAADPWRTNSALVKAANDMVIAKMPTQMPLCEAPSAPESTLATLAAGTVEPRNAGGRVRTGRKIVDDIFSWSFLRGQGAKTISSPLQILFIRSVGGRLRRILHDVVAFRTFHIVLIRVVINDRMLPAKIIPGRRGRNTPLERRPFPWVLRSGRALITAVNQVEDEDELRGASSESGDSDELVQRHQRSREVIHERRITPDVAHQSEVMERHENAVGTDEGEPEMQLALSF